MPRKVVTNNTDFGNSMLFVATFFREGLSGGRRVRPDDGGDLYRLGHAADLDLACIDCRYIGRFRKSVGRGQDLATAGKRCDPGRHVDADPTEVVATLRGVGGM
jgi:hypothetical protein